MKTASRKIKPHSIFTVWSPDEVAECMEGVSDALCQRLWDLVPEKYESAETPDVCCNRALVKVWRRLSAEDQTELNRLAEAHEAYLDRLVEPTVPNRIDAAIAESVREGRAVEITGAPVRHADLRERCAGNIDFGFGLICYWGTDASGNQWRIEVRD